MFLELRDKQLTRFDIVNVIMVLSTFYLICFGCIFKCVTHQVQLVKLFIYNLNKNTIVKVINTDGFSYLIMGIGVLIVSIYATKCSIPIIKSYRLNKLKIRFNKFNNEYM